MKTVLDQIMYGPQYWRESLSLFEGKEQKMIWLLTLKTALRTWWLTSKYFWWLLCIGGYIDVLAGRNAVYGRKVYHGITLLLSPSLASRIYTVFVLLITSVLILSVRASLEPKEGWYYLRSVPRLLLGALLFYALPSIYTVPLYWLGMLFYFDSDGSVYSFIRSVRNGITLFYTHLPVFLWAGAIHSGIFYGHKFLWDCTMLDEGVFLMYMFKFILGVFLQGIFIAMLGVLYIKITHSKKKLFTV